MEKTVFENFKATDNGAVAITFIIEALILSEKMRDERLTNLDQEEVENLSRELYTTLETMRSKWEGYFEMTEAVNSIIEEYLEVTQYYKIYATLTHAGFDGSSTFHRGNELGNLKFTDDEIATYFSDHSIQEMDKEGDSYYGLSALNDLFTQEEVAQVIANNYSNTMNLTVRAVEPKSLGDYYSCSAMSFDCRVKDGSRTLMVPSDGIFKMAIRWNDSTAEPRPIVSQELPF